MGKYKYTQIIQNLSEKENMVSKVVSELIHTSQGLSWPPSQASGQPAQLQTPSYLALPIGVVHMTIMNLVTTTAIAYTSHAHLLWGTSM